MYIIILFPNKQFTDLSFVNSNHFPYNNVKLIEILNETQQKGYYATIYLRNGNTYISIDNAMPRI